jgi:hypothetical protein
MKKSSVFEWHKQFKEDHISKLQMKAMLITFFNIKGIVHFEFIPQGQTVNQAYNVEILKQLHEAVFRERPEIWPSVWILHNDNVPTHEALSVKKWVTEKSITETEHPLCSPNFALNDFWLFPKIKSA